MEFENHIIFKDQKKLLQKAKKRFVPSYDLQYDISLIKRISSCINVDCSILDFSMPFTAYSNKLLDKRMNNEYYKYAENLFNNLPLYLESSKNYINLLNKNSYVSNDGFKGKIKYSDEEVIEFILDFFAHRSADEYKFAKDYFLEKRIFLLPDIMEDEADLAACYPIQTLDHTYINVKTSSEKMNLNTMLYLMHELGHAYECKCSLNRHNKFNDRSTRHTVEVSSLFYEIEFLKYLAANRVNPFEVAELTNNIYVRTKLWFEGIQQAEEDIIIYNDALYALEKQFAWYIDYDYNFVTIFRKYDDNLEPTEDFQEFILDMDSNMLYGMGGYIALHFSELKKQDPKEFNKNFNKFMSMRTLMDFESVLEMMGLNINEFLSAKLLEPELIKTQNVYKRQYKINM